jgi:hypothetical protein
MFHESLDQETKFNAIIVFHSTVLLNGTVNAVREFATKGCSR